MNVLRKPMYGVSKTVPGRRALEYVVAFQSVAMLQSAAASGEPILGFGGAGKRIVRKWRPGASSPSRDRHHPSARRSRFQAIFWLWTLPRLTSPFSAFTFPEAYAPSIAGSAACSALVRRQRVAAGKYLYKTCTLLCIPVVTLNSEHEYNMWDTDVATAYLHSLKLFSVHAAYCKCGNDPAKYDGSSTGLVTVSSHLSASRSSGTVIYGSMGREGFKWSGDSNRSMPYKFQCPPPILVSSRSRTYVKEQRSGLLDRWLGSAFAVYSPARSTHTPSAAKRHSVNLSRPSSYCQAEAGSSPSAKKLQGSSIGDLADGPRRRSCNNTAAEGAGGMTHQ
ncbi:hypothetical protein K437DRAFT_292759 [Tilletiaria anomala UBC 951]|uniref:Uncharacterized protein n=1 Tax=Tilletiaria anomala (strain ATCC 24038 / CBS 436.72 / UBC 951) TaxID=1037660 RepID=A0A066WPF8_TILAU|nr:uncharacterized protein K437DRAFT_292759 [Tilletiaria anomala UBC 951]KDN52859.1 hypothetical protein K437DRAFT_292759 [Tilletiaria anomala UBC 951]